MPLLLILVLLLNAAVYSQGTKTVEIQFVPGAPVLTEGQSAQIDDLLGGLSSYKITSVKIDGYCDEEQEMLFNLTMSVRRARSVYEYLESRKVPPGLMSYTGHGKVVARPRNAVELTVSYTRKDSVAKPQEVKKTRPGAINKDSLLAGKTIRLNLNFFPGESALLPAAMPYLAELERFLKENSEIRIQIDGHVCCNNNMQLSVERAAEVYDQLVKRGISSSRLTYRGFGNLKPLVKEEQTNEDREKNRRVEIKLLK
jgi:outer membrane protein OmpA-like peptidoglycan-associated protein